METEIKQTLESLLAGIKAGDNTAVGAAMERLDGVVLRERAALHPQLVHFLERRSYAKALMFLGGDAEIPVGLCGGRAGKS